MLCVGRFQDEAEAISLANASPFALSSSVWTANQKRARRAASQLSAGSCSVNDVIRLLGIYAAFGGNRIADTGAITARKVYALSRV